MTETPEQVIEQLDAEYGALEPWQKKQLSGNSYVAARMRSWAYDDADRIKYYTGRRGRSRYDRLPILSTRNCNHTYTVCASRECIESWSCDWNLYFRQTGGGRRLIVALRLTLEEVMALCDDTNRPITRRSISLDMPEPV